MQSPGEPTESLEQPTASTHSILLPPELVEAAFPSLLEASPAAKAVVAAVPSLEGSASPQAKTALFPAKAKQRPKASAKSLPSETKPPVVKVLPAAPAAPDDDIRALTPTGVNMFVNAPVEPLKDKVCTLGSKCHSLHIPL
jgi:hypothetical protein